MNGPARAESLSSLIDDELNNNEDTGKNVYSCDMLKTYWLSCRNTKNQLLSVFQGTEIVGPTKMGSYLSSCDIHNICT